MSYRTETDTLGEISIPAMALYGSATERAHRNFQISDRRFSRPFLNALGLIKWAGALANGELGRLEKNLSSLIASEALAVAEGRHDEHFILDVFQTGSGTSTNMNANEVIANLVNLRLGNPYGSYRPIHPNDHVNKGQSSNDVIPSAIHVAAALEIRDKLFPALKLLGTTLANKSREFTDVIKIGRTHLQDAVPMTLGQEFSGYAQQLTMARIRVEMAFAGLMELAIGGTAVGTGLNTHPNFAKKVCENLKQKTGLPFVEAQNHFEAQSARDACVFLSSTLKSLAIALMKIANDLRLLASGPRCGLGEIIIPELQAGSSIMPGKSNPVICESVMQIAAQVQGNDLVISLAGQNGNLELNAMLPVLADNLLESIAILSSGMTLFAEKCVDIITANQKRCAEWTENSLTLVTNLVPILGYDKAAIIAKKAHQENRKLRDVLEEEKILSPDELDKLLDPKKMLSPS